MPISIEELNGLYDPTGPGPKPKIVPPKQTEAFDLKQLDNKPESPITVGGARATDVEDYGKYLDQGVFSDQDIDSQRGQHQSVLNKMGHAIGNLPLNIVGTFMEGIGDLGLLGGQWGDDRTYTNALIEAGKAVHNATGDIYMRNQHNTVGQTLSDPSWWIDQVEGLAEFGVSYAALGAGVGGALSKMTEGAATALKAGQAGMQAGRMMGQLGTAGYMAYTMGASNAGEVFKSTYDYQFKKMINEGSSPDDAKTGAQHIAAQSAATTAQLTTAIGTVLALGSMGAYFRKSSDAALDILKKEAPQLPGETFQAWGDRIKAIDPDAYATILNPSKSISHKIAEMGKMGVEMQQLQFGHRTGEELGKEGKIKGFVDQFDELQNYFDRTMDKDGALAFGIGAVSGLGIDHIRERVIPSRWADKIDKTTGEAVPKLDEEGQPIGLDRKLYTPKALSEMHSRAKFNNIKDALAYDIEQFDKGQKAYLAAIKSGNSVDSRYERERMFNQHNVSTIINGMGDMWKKTYEEISQISPEEAVQRGYAADPSDYTYQDAAKKASSNMDKYQRMYDKLQTRYGMNYEQNQGYKDIVDGVFSRQVHLDSWNEMLTEHNERLNELKQDENKTVQELYPTDVSAASNAEHVRAIYSSGQTARTLTKEQTDLQKAISSNDVAAMAAFVAEYAGIDKIGNNSKEAIVKAAQAVHEQIIDTIKEERARIEEHKQAMSLNDGQNHNDLIKEMLEDLPSVEYQRQIELSEAKRDIAKKNLAEVMREKNLSAMAKKYTKYMQEEALKADLLEKQHDKEMANRAKNADAYARKDADQRNAVANRYREALDRHSKDQNDDIDRYNKAKSELDTNPDWLRKMGLRNQLRHLDMVIKKRQNLMDKYQAMYDKYYESDTSPVATSSTVDTNTITNNAPTIAIQAPYIEVPDPQFDAVSEEVENIIPNEEDFRTFKEQTKKMIAEHYSKGVEEAEARLVSTMNKHFTLEQSARILDGVRDMLDKDLFNGAVNFLIKEGVKLKEAEELTHMVRELRAAIDEERTSLQIEEFKKANEQVMPSNDPVIETIDEDIPEDFPLTFIDDTNAMAFQIPADNGVGGTTFGGSKTIDAGTIANSTLGYVEFAPNHNNEINLISQKDQINQKTNPDVLKPGKLMPGTNIRFEVDTEYDGPKNLVGQLKQDEYGNVPQGHESFADYSDNNGKVPTDKMGNVPIKIVDNTTGKTIGYVRKHEWVTERYGKDSGLRNIAEKFDEEGNEINGAIQSKRILDIRKAIVDRYNDTGLHTTGKTTSKGVGHPILNIEIKNKSSRERSEAKPGYAFNKKDGGLLPGKLEIVINDNGTLMSGKGFPTKKRIAGDPKAYRHGQVLVLLPGANGEHIPAPLVGKSLTESEIPHRTISRAIELYLSYNGDLNHPTTIEINKVKQMTGFDLSSEKGLRNFINQYFTHTQRFDDTAMIPNGASQQGNGRFLFNVWDRIPGKEGKAWIKAGITGSNNRPAMATLDTNGKLNQEFSEILKQGLATRTKAVTFSRGELRGLNEPTDADNPFSDIMYRSDGRWHPTHYSDYNEYVKAFSKTTAYGKNKIGNDYVYTANPSIAYDIDGLDENITKVEANTKPANVEVPTPTPEVYNESLANEMDEIFNAMPQRKPVVKEIGSAPDNSRPLDMKNLEDLYTFTPEDQRNGKVPADVMRELSDRGHTFLADGYNPFSLCL